MKKKVLIMCLIILLMTACTTPESNEVGNTQETEWELAKEMILAGKVKTVTQFHDLKVILVLKDGSQFTTTEPALDEVLRVVEQCSAACLDMGLITE